MFVTTENCPRCSEAIATDTRYSDNNKIYIRTSH